jgi:LPXTG-motif cell wall-anchored protein
VRQRRLSTLGLGLTGALLAGLLMPGTAQAAPGDARARGVVIALDATVARLVVVDVDAVVGAADAPAGGGTDTDTALDLAAALSGAVGVTATGTVEEVTATRAATGSSASATVADVDLDVLGLDTLGTGDVTATATCPRTGPLTADTTLAGLTLFGEAVTLDANAPGVTASAAVTVPGLAAARLAATLTRVETVTGANVVAVAVRVTLSLTTGTPGLPTRIPLGTVTIASATCERPAAAPAAPTATGITPDTGPTTGGQTVTITGTGFVPGGTTVTFDGVPATDVVVAPGGTSLTVVTPANTAGPAAVVVTTPAGAAAPLTYTYVAAPAAPTATGITPDTGPTTGGQTVTITGTGFVPGDTTVTFDGVPATNVVVAPDGTSLTAVTPANTAGPAAVVVTTPAGAAAPLAYTYVAPAPALTGLTPDSGPTAGGTTVTITGTGLGDTEAVLVDGVPVPFTVNPAGTAITITTPPHAAGTVDVVVQVPGADLDPLRFTYTDGAAAATVTGIDPTRLPTSGGTTVTITGTNLTGATGVNFGGTPGTDVQVSPDGTSITVTAPARETAGETPVEVVFPDGTVDAPPVTYVAPDVEFVANGIGPTTGGTRVEIRGTGLEAATGVTFDGRPGRIERATPLVAGTDGSPRTAPEGAAQAAGPARTAATARFAAIAAPPPTVLADTVLIAVTPPNEAGPATIRVILPGRDAVATNAFLYIPPLRVTGLTPDSGPTAGGQTVVITGAGFAAGATTVTFDGVPAQVQVQDGDTLIVVTPPGTAGPADVVVTVAGVDSPALRYTYVAGVVVPAAPSAGALDPTSGPIGGGTEVTVTGSNFVPGQTTVIICGSTLPAGQVDVAADGGSLSFTTPACAAGAQDVVVVTPGGTTAALPFTYVGPGGLGSGVGGVGPEEEGVGGDGDGDGLPDTGADVVGITGLGVLMLVVGAVLARRARRREGAA